LMSQICFEARHSPRHREKVEIQLDLHFCFKSLSDDLKLIKEVFPSVCAGYWFGLRKSLSNEIALR
ncbi:hypothetical protein, partial [Glutamicibacter sp.]